MFCFYRKETYPPWQVQHIKTALAQCPPEFSSSESLVCSSVALAFINRKAMAEATGPFAFIDYMVQVALGMMLSASCIFTVFSDKAASDKAARRLLNLATTVRHFGTRAMGEPPLWSAQTLGMAW